jgi:hypothetical protein
VRLQKISSVQVKRPAQATSIRSHGQRPPTPRTSLTRTDELFGRRSAADRHLRDLSHSSKADQLSITAVHDLAAEY